MTRCNVTALGKRMVTLAVMEDASTLVIQCIGHCGSIEKWGWHSVAQMTQDQQGMEVWGQLELPALFMENLNFSLERQAVQESEVFFRESFIFPFLQQAWRRHPKLKLWVNQTLKYMITCLANRITSSLFGPRKRSLTNS